MFDSTRKAAAKPVIHSPNSNSAYRIAVASYAPSHLARQRNRGRRRLRLALIALLSLTVVFGLLLYFVPGSPSRAAVANKLHAASEGITPTMCTGKRPTYSCVVTDGSGTPAATYRVTVSGSCWHATRVARNASAESNPPARLSGCLRLWNNLFPTL